ncbi:DNA polymerase III subunit beta [Nonomuraea sp. NPDC059194]|uniref:DNA polymerase III subunit beta n=1 Tax=Nonomuraea sp. NPDC059194 TaxID=3346764 RepID=UPI00368A1F37
MKLTIMAGELADAVGWVSHALPKRPSAPVLGGILAEVDDDGVTFCAFDYDTSRRITVELDSPLTPGRALLPGRVLAELVKALPKGELVDVAVDEKEAVVQCGRAEFALPLMPVDDYPNLPKQPAAVGTVHSKMLGYAVAQAAVAASTDDSLPLLTGVRLEVGDGLIDLAATDRYRLTWRTLAWSPVLDGPADVKALIPARILQDIARSLPEGDVAVGLGDGLASFSCKGRSTTVRLLDPEFPDFRAMFAKVEAATTATVDGGELVKVVKRVALMAPRSTPVRLSFGQGRVLVEAGGEEGRAAEAVDCKVDGADVTIPFNAAYLVDALNAFTGGPVQVRVSTPGRPCLLKRADDDTYQHIVMSIRAS